MVGLSDKVKAQIEEVAARAGLTTGAQDMAGLLILFVFGVIVYKAWKKK